MSKFVAFLKDESGASAAEYVLILAIIGSGIALAATNFGDSLGDALDRARGVIDGVDYGGAAPAAPVRALRCGARPPSSPHAQNVGQIVAPANGLEPLVCRRAEPPALRRKWPESDAPRPFPVSLRRSISP